MTEVVSNQSRVPLAVSVTACVLWMLQTLHVLFAMVFLVPKYEEIYKDFGVALPAMTRWLIMLSRDFCGNRPGQAFSVQWILLPVWIGAVVGATVLCATRRSPWPALALLVLSLLSWVVWWPAMTLAMQTPMNSMIHSLRGGQ